MVGLAMTGLLFVAAALHSQIYFVVRAPHHLVLHTVLELSSILISFSVFVVNWESSKQNQNAQSLFVGTGFLAVAIVDTMHTLSNEGMPDLLTPNTMDEALYYCLVARLWAAALLWMAAYVKPEGSSSYLDRRFLLMANLGLCAASFGLVSGAGGLLPPLYLSGYGATWLMALLVFVTIGVSLAGAVAHLRLYRFSHDESELLIVAALVMGALGVSTLLMFLGPGDVYLLISHLYKLAGCYLVFKALTVTSVHRPYAQLKVAKDRLERTVAALDARNRELDALDEVAVALGATLRPEEVLETAIDKVMQVMQAGAGAVFLLDEGGNELRLVTWRGLTPSVVDDCNTHSLQMPRPAAPDGDDSEMDWIPDDPVLVRRLGGPLARVAPFGACTCAPIVSKGRLLGSIVMVAVERRSFSLKDADLLMAIGYQFGLAIENARLYEQTDERLRGKIHEVQKAERRSRFLYEVGALFASSMELGQVLDLVAKKSVDVVGDSCSIYLLDEQGTTLTLEALHYKDEKDLGFIRHVLGHRPIPVGEGFVGLAATSGEPVLQGEASREDVAAEVRQLAESVEEIALLRRTTPSSRIAAPMRAHGHTLGVLLVTSTSPWQPLGEADLSLVVELAGRAGAAIENRRLFQESQFQRRHLEAIISQMVDGVVVTDSMGERLVVNASAQRMLAGRGDELLGAPRREVGILEGRPASDAGGWNRSLVARALAGELVVGDEVRGAGVGGERILSASASPVRDEAGAVTGAVVVLRDVTAEREVERMKDEFVATTSHELRTPITAVLGYTDILLRGLRGPLTAKQREALESVRGAAVRLLALINDLLDMSRLEAGKQEVALASTELAPAVERALSAVSVLAASKGIQLRQSLVRNLPRVMADDEQLQRILGNLLANAIKFTPQGGSVVLSARPWGGEETRGAGGDLPGDEAEREVVVTIADTGIGIPREYQERIWEKFQQVDSSSRRLFGGTGLGLAITKGLVELHGGRVWVESEGVSGRGSTFGFTLRVAGEKA